MALAAGARLGRGIPGAVAGCHPRGGTPYRRRGKGMAEAAEGRRLCVA